jgi:hypothetical protein
MTRHSATARHDPASALHRDRPLRNARVGSARPTRKPFAAARMQPRAPERRAALQGRPAGHPPHYTEPSNSS